MYDVTYMCVVSNMLKIPCMGGVQASANMYVTYAVHVRVL